MAWAAQLPWVPMALVGGLASCLHLCPADNPQPPVPSSDEPVWRRLGREASHALVWNVPPGAEVHVIVEASLGGLTHTWEEGPFTPSAAGTVQARLDPPASAKLHETACDYVTVLRVRVVQHLPDGHTLTRRAPPAALAWLNDCEEPTIWDKRTALLRAPNGVVSDVVRQQLGDRHTSWVQPPVPVGTRRSE